MTEFVRDPNLSVTIGDDSAITFGTAITLNMAVPTGYQAKINSVSPVRGGTFTAAAFTASGGTHTNTMELPLSVFTASETPQAVSITCAVEWAITNRRLRQLEGQEYDDFGEKEITLDVIVMPLDSSGAYSVKVVSMSSAAVAATGAMVMLL